MITPTIVDDNYLEEAAARANHIVEHVRAGARKGTLIWSRTSLTARLNLEAERAALSGDTEKALEFAKTQNAGKPPSAQQALLLAVTYRALGKPDLQREVLEAALKHQPQGSGWQLELALHELEQGRPDRAAAQFEAILEAYPEDKPLLPYLAFWAGYAVADSQPETARARWQRGRERPRAWPDAFWGDACGRALGEVGAEALAESAQLEGVGQRNSGPFVEGFACEQAGDTAGARAHYEEVLANARLGGHEFPAGVARARLGALGD